MTYCKKHPETKYLGLRAGEECPICWAEERDSTHNAPGWWDRLVGWVAGLFGR